MSSCTMQWSDAGGKLWLSIGYSTGWKQEAERRRHKRLPSVQFYLYYFAKKGVGSYYWVRLHEIVKLIQCSLSKIIRPVLLVNIYPLTNGQQAGWPIIKACIYIKHVCFAPSRLYFDVKTSTLLRWPNMRTNVCPTSIPWSFIIKPTNFLHD